MDRGGAETLVMNIYRKIDRKKVSFDFLVHSKDKGKYDDEISSLGGNIYYIPSYKIWNHISYVNAWKKFMRENGNYDIVHAHMTGPAAVFLPIAKKYGSVTISHSHTSLKQPGLKSKLIQLYQLPLRRISDYLFACSDLAGKWVFGEKALKQDNYFLVKNAVDTEKFSFNVAYRTEIRNMYNLSDKFVIGYVARFHPQKNHTFLIDVFYELSKMDEDSRLVLVGDGEERKNIEKKVEELGLSDKVVFTGVTSKVEKFLSAIDTIVMPSLNEGLPVSLVEAQASGVRILTNDKISKEIKLTELVEMYELENGAKKWAEKILEYKNKQRVLDVEVLKNKGYDINQLANWITNFYVEKAEMKK